MEATVAAPSTVPPAARTARAASDERRAGRDDVVDEQDPPPGERDAHGHAVGDVREPVVASEPQLVTGPAGRSQRIDVQDNA